MTSDFQEHSRRVRHDTVVTVLVGPLRLLLILLGTLFLLRIVLARAGLEVVGLWSLLNVVSAVISLMDIGFSPLLTREIHVWDDASRKAEHHLDKRAIEWLYGVGFTIVVVPALLGLVWLAPNLPYDRVRFAVALMLMAGGSLFQLFGKLETTILAAHQKNASVQVLHMLGMFIFLAFAILGACLDAPLEGAALGTCLSAGWMWWRLARKVTADRLLPTSPTLAVKDLMRRIPRLARAGFHFYFMNLGTVLREPVFRVMLTALLGTQMLGMYTIAFRLSVAVRDLVAAGFGVLFPSLASLYRAENRPDIAGLQSASLVFLLVFGSVALGCLYGFIEPLYVLLLGPIPVGLAGATRILVMWNAITLFNVPFDLLLQATGHERISAVSLWAHTFAIVLLGPLGLCCRMDLFQLLAYWTTTSLITQFIIFYYTQKKLNAFWPVIRTPPVTAVLVLSMVFWLAVVGWVAVVHAPPAPWAQALVMAKGLLPACIALMVGAYMVAGRLFEPFWRRS